MADPHVLLPSGEARKLMGGVLDGVRQSVWEGTGTAPGAIADVTFHVPA